VKRRGRRPFWLRPIWVLGHVICLLLIVLFVNLGFWQISRYHEKLDRRHLINGRMTAAAVPAEEVLDGDPPAADVAYRRVEVSGTWVPDQTLLVRSRTKDGRPGYHVLTLLDLGGGRGLVVNRGFAPNGGGGEAAIRRAVRVPAARVTIQGIVRPPETRGRFGPKDPATGRLDVLNRIDVARIQQQTPALDLGHVALQLTSPAPAEGAVPELLPLPATDLGPHRSYAVQWFIFATVGAVGWPLLLRRTAQEEAREREPDDVEPPLDPLHPVT
jgi:cytochrome oxidase assembly protein ShyY1